MAHSLSAKKRIRQTLDRNARNRWRKDRVKTAVKDFDLALEAGNYDKAQELLNKAASVLDKVASTPTLHKNVARRRRSKLQQKLNKAKAGSA